MTTTSGFGLFIIRVVLGVIMIAHGVQKLTTVTIPGVQGMLEGVGVPFAPVLAPILAYGEVVIGALLILGFLTRPAGLATAVIGLGALFLVHLPAGFYVADGGYEFVLLLAAAGIGLALTGAGRIAVDGALAGRRRGARGRDRADAAHAGADA